MGAPFCTLRLRVIGSAAAGAVLAAVLILRGPALAPGPEAPAAAGAGATAPAVLYQPPT